MTTIERLGKYEIRGILGKGAMGTVYAAWDPIISRQVAIKTVRLPDATDIDAQEELARFKREAQAAGRLTHPNIVGIFDYGESDDLAYIVMEFVDGQTLKNLLGAEERMPVATVARIMADLLAGLGYSHERGVVHRDIKPANVMIVGEGHASGQAKIADFGIARIESSNLTQAGTIMGTPAYMSPEQFMGQTVDARTDIYSSGVLLFQLLTGERPFEGSMATIMHKALHTQPPKPSDLSVTAPVALDAVVTRAMARRPDDRFPDAASFAAAIVDALENRATSPGLGIGLGDDFDTESTVISPPARPPAAPTRSPAVAEPRRRSNTPVLAGVAVLVVAAAGAGGAWWAGLIGAPESANPQIAGSTRTVAAPGQDVVAITPPSAPDTSPATDTPAPQAPATDTSPPPRRDVTQIVPPTTIRTASAPPAPTEPIKIIPPVSPPAIAQNPRLEPALVTPAPSALVTSQTVSPPQPERIEPADPARARTPEPPVATAPPPAQAIVPPDTPPPAIPGAPATTAALVSPEALRRAVGAAVQGADCAAVRGDLTRSGTLSMQGVVGGGAPTQDLLRHIRDVAPNSPLDWTVEELNGPYCAALNLIRAYTRPFGSVSGGMDVGLKDGLTSLREDDKIDIRAQVPDFPAYLQVDYFASDGSVYHVQNALQGTPMLPARALQSYASFEVGPPFGTDLVIAIASSVPLFTKGQAMATDAEPYLRQLRAALDAAIKRRAELAAGTVAVHTSPKS